MARANIICFASSKGGSGKTVTSASLAHLLSFFGKQVLLVDADAATNGLTLLFLEELAAFKNNTDVSSQKCVGMFELATNNIPSPFTIGSGLDLIPASYTLRQTEFFAKADFQQAMSVVMGTYGTKYDYIILDAQAGSDEFARIAIQNAHKTVIVSEYDPISAEGVERLKKIFSNELSYDNTWVLLNKVLPEFSKSLTKYLSVFRFLSPIPWDADVIRSFSMRKICLDMNNVNDYTLAIIKMAQTLLAREVEGAIDDWYKTKEAKLREPAKQQLDETENIITDMEKAIVENEYFIKHMQYRSKRISQYVTTILVSVAITSLATYVYIAKDGLLENTKSLLSTSVALAAVIPVLFLVFKELFEKFTNKRYRKEQINRMEMLHYQKRKLEELKQHKSKIATIVESDLETLLLNKK